MKIAELKILIGNKVKVEYLSWGDLRNHEGILEEVNGDTMIVGGRKVPTNSDVQIADSGAKSGTGKERSFFLDRWVPKGSNGPSKQEVLRRYT